MIPTTHRMSTCLSTQPLGVDPPNPLATPMPTTVHHPRQGSYHKTTKMEVSRLHHHSRVQAIPLHHRMATPPGHRMVTPPGHRMVTPPGHRMVTHQKALLHPTRRRQRRCSKQAPPNESTTDGANFNVDPSSGTTIRQLSSLCCMSFVQVYGNKTCSATHILHFVN